MATFTACEFVSSDQLKSICQNIMLRENGIRPNVLSMAIFALSGKICFLMINDRGGKVIGLVTRDTRGFVSEKGTSNIVSVAALTCCNYVRTD